MAQVTLLTDFGTSDSYVAQMKGVLLSEGPPGLQLVDLAHDLPRQDVHHAARFLAEALPHFPPGTIHLCVVDPGVGTARLPLVVHCRGQWVVAPDNGLATFPLDQGGNAYAIEVGKIASGPASGTFHGRDIFARAAARLAHGESADGFARPLASPVRLRHARPEESDDRIAGEIVGFDHFGNALTNLAWEPEKRGVFTRVRCGHHVLTPVRNHYAEVDPGAPIALVDSQGRLEIAVREGSAERELRLRRGDRVYLERG